MDISIKAGAEFIHGQLAVLIQIGIGKTAEHLLELIVVHGAGGGGGDAGGGGGGGAAGGGVVGMIGGGRV